MLREAIWKSSNGRAPAAAPGTGGRALLPLSEATFRFFSGPGPWVALGTARQPCELQRCVVCVCFFFSFFIGGMLFNSAWEGQPQGVCDSGRFAFGERGSLLLLSLVLVFVVNAAAAAAVVSCWYFLCQFVISRCVPTQAPAVKKKYAEDAYHCCCCNTDACVETSGRAS